MSDARHRVAVVGLGWMGSDHARILAAHPAAELVAVVDTDAERARSVAGSLGVHAATSLEEVLELVDAVSVCTPDHTHEELTVQALSQGKHVLVEKPLATDLTAARRMVAAADWGESALTVGHLLDADPRIERARLLLRSGALGDLWHARVRRHSTRAIATHVAGASSVGWFGTIHDADLLVELMAARPVSVRATGVTGLVTDTWDVIDATVRFDGGQYATLHESWTLGSGRANRSDSGLTIVGSGGAIELDLGHGQLLHSDERSSVAPDVLHYPSANLADSSDLQRELDRWLRSIDGAQLGVGGRRALTAVAVVEAVHRSLDSGQEETVDN